MDAVSYGRVQSRLRAIEQAIRTIREESQGLQDDSVARYGKDSAHLTVIAIGVFSEGLQKLEDGPLGDLIEEVGMTEAEAEQHQIERYQARAG
jgi:hypothetical protein